MIKTVRHLLKDESGATAIEYGLIAALVAVVLIGVLQTMGTTLRDEFQEVIDGISGAGGGATP